MGQKAKKNGNTELLATSPQSYAREVSGRTPLPEEIRRRAFEIYLERGGEQGRDLEDWLQAERELRAI